MSATTATLDMRNITPLPSGAYRVRVEHGGAVLGGIEASVEAAAALRDAIKRQIADDDLVPAGGRTIAELGREFLASRSGNRSSRSDGGRWQHIGSSSLGKRVPSTVTVKDVVNWLAALQTKKTNYDAKKQGKRETKLLSRQTRKHALNLLRCFFVWAVEQEHATGATRASVSRWPGATATRARVTRRAGTSMQPTKRACSKSSRTTLSGGSSRSPSERGSARASSGACT
jgi:hypothetical protein